MNICNTKLFLVPLPDSSNSTEFRYKRQAVDDDSGNGLNANLGFLQVTRKGRDIGLFITLVPKVFLFVGLTTLGVLLKLYWLVHLVLTFHPLIVIYRRNKLVYFHWGWTCIYPPLSYPLKGWESRGEGADFRMFIYFCRSG